VIDKETGQFIGYGGLRSLMDKPELVYHLAQVWWGRGLATELARASLRFGFEEHHFESILAVAKAENVASIHVLEKVGLHFDMNTSYYNIEVVQYRISRSEFRPDGALYVLA
jgi:ribosomal-protein-alanine N-acetyltransferase